MTNPAVFFVPHQDDEVLTLGPYMLQHIEAGRDVHVVLFTDGQSSGERTLLANEGYPLSYSAFSKSRDREFYNAVYQLGVPLSNVYLENLEDGTLAKGLVKTIMRKYINLLGPGSYKTISWMDQHKDHFVLGRSLDELNREGAVPNKDARFCRSLAYLDAPTPGGSWQYSADNAPLVAAASEYNVWYPDAQTAADNPSAGPRYRVGYRSVESQFNNLLSNPRSWVHADSSGYSASGRSAANAWLSARGLTAYL